MRLQGVFRYFHCSLPYSSLRSFCRMFVWGNVICMYDFICTSRFADHYRLRGTARVTSRSKAWTPTHRRNLPISQYIGLALAQLMKQVIGPASGSTRDIREHSPLCGSPVFSSLAVAIINCSDSPPDFVEHSEAGRAVFQYLQPHTTLQSQSVASIINEQYARRLSSATCSQ